MTLTLRAPQHFSNTTFAEKTLAEISDPNLSVAHLYNSVHYVQPWYGNTNFNDLIVQTKSDISEENLFLWLKTYLFKTLIPETTRLTHQTAPAAYLSAYQYATVQEDPIPAHTFVDAIQTLFDGVLKDWREVVSKIERKNIEIFKLKETIIPLDKIVKELEEATRKNREKDIARAERRQEKTLQDLEKLESLNEELVQLQGQFSWVRKRMIPVRKLEGYIPSVKILTIKGEETFAHYVQLLTSILRLFPELYEETLTAVSSHVNLAGKVS